MTGRLYSPPNILFPKFQVKLFGCSTITKAAGQFGVQLDTDFSQIRFEVKLTQAREIRNNSMNTKSKFRCKYLISSPCRISGQFDNGFMRIRDAYDRSKLYFNYNDPPIAQNFYAIEGVVEE